MASSDAPSHRAPGALTRCPPWRLPQPGAASGPCYEKPWPWAALMGPWGHFTWVCAGVMGTLTGIWEERSEPLWPGATSSSRPGWDSCAGHHCPEPVCSPLSPSLAPTCALQARGRGCGLQGSQSSWSCLPRPLSSDGGGAGTAPSLLSSHAAWTCGCLLPSGPPRRCRAPGTVLGGWSWPVPAWLLPLSLIPSGTSSRLFPKAAKCAWLWCVLEPRHV